MSHTITWVTDPYHPDISKIQHQIISNLKLERVLSSISTTIFNSTVRYTFVLSDGQDLDHINAAIRQIDYLPLSFSLRSEDISRVEALKSILRAYIGKTLRLKVREISTTFYDDNLITLTPLIRTKSGDYSNIYLPTGTLNDVVAGINLESLLGFTLLSRDALSNYAVSALINVAVADAIVRMNDMYLINADSQYENFRQDVSTYIKRLKTEGYFTYPESLSLDIDDISDAIRLANAFKLEIVSTSIPLVLKGHIDDSMTASSWFKYNVDRIQDDELPIVHLDFKDLESEQSRPRLTVAAIKALVKVYTDYDIEALINNIKVGSNLLLSVPVDNIQRLEDFKYQLSMYMTTLARWAVFPVDSIKEGLRARYNLNLSYPELESYLVNIDDIEYVVLITANGDPVLDLSHDYDAKADILSIRGLYPVGDIAGLLPAPLKRKR